ncbi:MAG: class I SAM-dependent methyltransferase [Gammaproteobacteria bacterium]
MIAKPRSIPASRKPERPSDDVVKRAEKLTGPEYWEQGYRPHAPAITLPDLRDFRQLPEARVVDLLESTELGGKRVLEVGAGDSTVLLLLAARSAGNVKFTGLDYTDTGCKLLRERSQALDSRIEVVNADLFDAPKEMLGQFDLVYSMGLVEHFDKLDHVLAALARLLKPDGLMVTIIPNMHGILGTLTKRWNRSVYDLHNPHGLSSFLSGHAEAGLRVRRYGYLCSSHFGVLSSCFADGRQRGASAYELLSRVSKAGWWFESHFFDLPKSGWLSPYIFSISSRAADASH